MLRCPQCGNTYTDETLRFCLADGAGLVPVRADEPATVRMETPARATTSHAAPGKVPVGFKIILGLVAFFVVAGSFAMVAALIYVNRRKVSEPPAPPKAMPAAAAETSPDTEKIRLQRELAEAQRKLNSTNGGRANGALQAAEAVTAKVNSPKDGFLALREQPSTEFGEPIAKIPHGTTITLGQCVPIKTTVDTRSGHWCTVTYDGKEGWVFDAWVDKTGR